MLKAMKYKTRIFMEAASVYLMKGGFLAGFIWGLTGEAETVLWHLLNGLSAGLWCCAPGVFLVAGFEVANDDRIKRGW